MIALALLFANFSIDADLLSYDVKTEKLHSSSFILTLPDGSRLHGPKATVYYNEKGELLAEAGPGERIFFSGSVEEGEIRRPLLMKGESLQLGWRDKISATCSGNVEIECNDSYVAFGDKAHFSGDEGGGDALQTAGLVTIEGGIKKARVQMKSGDRIDFDRLTLEMKTGRLEGWGLEGWLSPRATPLTFRSDHAVFFPREGQLRLDQEILAESVEMGVLKASETVLISLNDEEVTRLLTEGFTELTLGKKHLLSFGEMEIDLVKGEMRIASPPQARLEQQARYEDELGKIYADRFTMRFSLGGKEPKMESLLFEGNVRLMTRHTPEKVAFIEQYALADRVEFSPEAGVLKLTASPANRVLYFDKGEGIQVSADDLTVRRGVKGAEVKSEGIVKMKLSPSEASQLRKLIPLLKE